MTRTQKVTLIALVVALVEGGAVALFAQGPGERGAAPFGGRGGPGGRGFAAGFALGQLDLSDAQKQQVRDITQRHRQQTQPLAQRLQQAMEAQRAAIQRSGQRIAGAFRRPGSRRGTGGYGGRAGALHSDIFAVLTAEQTGEGEAARSAGPGEGKGAAAARSAPA